MSGQNLVLHNDWSVLFQAAQNTVRDYDFHYNNNDSNFNSWKYDYKYFAQGTILPLPFEGSAEHAHTMMLIDQQSKFLHLLNAINIETSQQLTSEEQQQIQHSSQDS